MNLQETFFFLSQLSHGFDHIGAIFPTSRRAARMMAGEAMRQKSPKAILEVGPGTGPITTELVRHMKADDRLVLCEVDKDFVAYLRRRFENETDLQRVKHQVEILHQSVTDMEGEARFDHIISAVPFTRLPAELTEQIFATYRRLLKPGGTLTFLEYKFLRKLRRWRPRTNHDAEFLKIDQILKDFINRYQFRKDHVMLNIPPANVRSLRFSEPAPEAARDVQPRENFKRVGPRWSNLAMNSEAMDLVVGLGGIAYLLARAGSRWWKLPAALAAGAAWFHRDPHREVLPTEKAAYAASDGQVMKVDTVRHPRLGDQTWARVCVFLSPLDVHINRSPVAGKVVDRWDEPGGFLPAFLEDESESNASRYIVIQGMHGLVAVAQRAGFLARRIITWPTRGELLAQGERYGLIRFGSRTDVLFPADKVEVVVRPGDKLAAGQTILARYL
jgi:phosphatidylserine decarboxylase